MQPNGLTLPPLYEVFPEGFPSPQPRQGDSASQSSWTPVPQRTSSWPSIPSTESASTIRALPYITSTCATWSTGASTPRKAVDSMLNATDHSRASSFDSTDTGSPGSSSASSISRKCKVAKGAGENSKGRSDKTKKEQRSRRVAQRIYQDKEDILNILVQWTQGRTQSKGNKKSSGLSHTKHDIDHGVNSLLAHCLSRELEQAAFEGKEAELLEQWVQIISGGEDGDRGVTEEPLKGSLLWYDEIEHLEHPGRGCIVKATGRDECHQHTMKANKERRLQEIRDAAARQRYGQLPIHRRGDVVNKRARL